MSEFERTRCLKFYYGKRGAKAMEERMNYKKILKAFGCTILITVLSMVVIFQVIGFIFRNMSVEDSYVWAIICMCMGIIFTIFYCSFTILDEIKKLGGNGHNDQN
jgi:ABC-type amino acid transport system permease subunit